MKYNYILNELLEFNIVNDKSFDDFYKSNKLVILNFFKKFLFEKNLLYFKFFIYLSLMVL